MAIIRKVFIYIRGGLVIVIALVAFIVACRIPYAWLSLPWFSRAILVIIMAAFTIGVIMPRPPEDKED